MQQEANTCIGSLGSMREYKGAGNTHVFSKFVRIMVSIMLAYSFMSAGLGHAPLLTPVPRNLMKERPVGQTPKNTNFNKHSQALQVMPTPVTK